MGVWAKWRDAFPTAVSASQILSKPDIGSSTNGQPQSSSDITQACGPVRPVRAEGMPYIEGMASQYVNPLGANPAGDWEQYQGCRVPNLKPGGITMLEPWCNMAVSDLATQELECLHSGGSYNYSEQRCIYSRLDAQREREASKPSDSPLDKQVGGDHYKKAAMQPIEYIQANGLTFCEGNAVKYITRHRVKGGKADLEKAIHYLQLEIAHSYGPT